ncbi:hypothetical protein CDAR_440451 [Caerostris darwini]|uniref:Uncharacterized protein n=1 Tax=Caerostris darwini TaxID=1538125 RepID=A0AAV4X8X8_9ARAC|nr:hypothetical protein CDAR_440451 [Caerostris darwini]
MNGRSMMGMLIRSASSLEPYKSKIDLHSVTSTSKRRKSSTEKLKPNNKCGSEKAVNEERSKRKKTM